MPTFDLLAGPVADGAARPMLTQAEWMAHRKDILLRMQEAMGPLPTHTPPPMELRIEEETARPGYACRKISFATEDWDRLCAYLLVPDGLKKTAPGVLALHPTSASGKGAVMGLGEPYYPPYALELAQRGYVVLAPDYPGFGDAVETRKRLYQHGYASCTMKGIWNHMRCLDVLCAMPEVDKDRLASMGHSLGGHNTLFAGIFDPRFRVMASSCGFTRFGRYMNGDLTGWSHAGYMPRVKELYHCSPERMPFDFTEVLAALAPRAVFVCAPLDDANFDVTGVVDCVNAAGPVYELLGATGRLVAQYPPAAHDFPKATRETAYAFLARWL